MSKHKNNNSNVLPIEEDFRTLRDKALQREYSTKGKTTGQNRYIKTIQEKIITFGIGPAGTGKSHLPLTLACDALASGLTEKIVLFTPTVECGSKKGFLPGDEQEKIAPYIESMKSILRESYGDKFVAQHIERESLIAKSISYIRGGTFNNAWVILDEAQNTTIHEMKTFLTRIGENCKVIITGDILQVDIKEKSGLVDAIERLQGIDEIGIHQMTIDDCVRSEIVKKILSRYEPHHYQSNS